MGALTREQFLKGKPALKQERVPLPEFGDGSEIIVQEMTAADRERYAAALEFAEPEDGTDQPRQVKPGKTYATLAIFTIVGEDGKRLFADDDVEELASYPSDVLERIAKVAYRVNGLGEVGAEQARKN